MNLCRGTAALHLEPARDTPFFHSSSALGGDPMSVQVTPHPKWVADLDAVLDPSREAILDTRVIVDASENQLVDGRIQNFLVNFYPIIRDFPQWLQEVEIGRAHV